MESIRDQADRAWAGDEAASQGTGSAGRLFEVVPGIALATGFGLSIAIQTADGLVIVDTSGRNHGQRVVEAIRAWDDRPIRNVVYTHGHFDHVGGMPAFDADAEARGYPRPRVIAHANVPRRFDRYTRTAGYNATINARQFFARPEASAEEVEGWTRHRYPDVTYEESYRFEQGGLTFELRHGKGETDDHTWVWIPELKAICAGDFFIWRTPNAGNPQKVQRYPVEWAQALRAMAAMNAGVFIPSHGVPIYGADRIARALDETATLLETLVEQTLELLNRGARLDEAIHTVRAPEELLAHPYLRPYYDEPEFIVRNVWRMYGGWYDGNPANLKPAPEADLAGELARLVGGPGALARRAQELADGGSLRLACHLAEFAALAAPGDPAIRETRAKVYAARAAAEHSLMARGIFNAAAREPAPGG
ncbi:alkyl sulfatase dimerization domain-containing protein [Tepidiforma sp.]|jgi:alkyl sulfatase BDS1-like metallo-beta-lactamase superfamily hydrolase|uniref:alkyl sulfatase dimerization domain-containing protein n=1 Tax=Tepidiforma sp. TaxID=2682230 RepID=UPI00261E0EBD|nr:alkyl sulfatase dimerization domain-containing protein [Tepidiforma sp.]MCX7617364.1 MBL fold metallo-hydrolase [Tepidiforma sp.]